MANESHQTTVRSSRPIRARVHEGALRRVTRFFASTAGDIFTELLQNARRGGATRVSVHTEDLFEGPSEYPDQPNPQHIPQPTPQNRSNGIRVTVTDDGAGVADPAVLLSFGETGWDKAVAHNEDAAGMGLASLARRGCRVSSRPALAMAAHRDVSRDVSKDGPAPGWCVDLTPAHFLGEEEAMVFNGEDAPYPNGTAVSFTAEETPAAVEAALARAALHYPLAVTFDGEAVDRRAFLDGAVPRR